MLDPRCLLTVRISPESRVSAERGAAPARLVEQGWRAFLIKVRNEAGDDGRPQTWRVPRRDPSIRPGTGLAMVAAVGPARRCGGPVARSLHLQAEADGAPPVRARARVPDRAALQPRSRPPRGAASARQSVPARRTSDSANRTAVLFDVAPSRDVTLRVRDENGRPAMASLRHQGHGRPRLPVATQASRAGFLLPGPDLSRRRRAHSSSCRRSSP